MISVLMAAHIAKCRRMKLNPPLGAKSDEELLLIYNLENEFRCKLWNLQYSSCSNKRIA